MAGKGLLLPIKRLTMSVKDVIVTETAASDNICAVLSGTFMVTGVLLHAASITKVSSIPIPTLKKLRSKLRTDLISGKIMNYIQRIFSWESGYAMYRYYFITLDIM